MLSVYIDSWRRMGGIPGTRYSLRETSEVTEFKTCWEIRAEVCLVGVDYSDRNAVGIRISQKVGWGRFLHT